MKWSLSKAFTLVVLTVAGTLFDAPFSAAAQAYEIRVRGRAELTADVTSAGTNLQVFGRLRDDLQQGLPQRRVQVRVLSAENSSAVEENLYTDFRGAFHWHVELEPGAYSVEFTLAESEHLTAATLSREVRVEASVARLDLRLPSLVGEGAREIPLQIIAISGGSGLAGQVHLFVNESGHRLVDLDRFGRVRVDLLADALSGKNTVEIVLPGTAYRQEVRAQGTFHRLEDLDARLEARSVFERFDRGVEVLGTVSDRHGPVEGLALEIFLVPHEQDEPEVSPLQSRVSTDGRGRFRHVFSGPEIFDGNWKATVRAVPDLGAPVSWSTGPIELSQQSSRRLLNLVGLLGIIGVALLFLGQVGREVWRKIAKWRAHRRALAAREASFSETEVIVPLPLADEADEGEEETDESRFVIAGMAWDIWRHRPVAEAQISLHIQGNTAREAMAVHSDGVGRFRFEPLPAGRYELAVLAPGFVEGRMVLTLPHGGRLGRFRLDLIAVPLKIRRVYQTMVEAFEGEDLWGRLTPRQIEEVLWEGLGHDAQEESGQPQSSGGQKERREDLRKRIESFHDGGPEGRLDGMRLLDLMTQLVEESYFSGSDVETSQWLIARDIAMRLTALASEEGS